MQETIEESAKEAISGFTFDMGHQVRELQAQNAQLLTVLEEKEKEICNLRGIVDATAEAAAHDATTKKVLELAKKNRNLQVALQNERQKVCQLREKLENAKEPSVSQERVNAEGVEEIARELVKEAAQNADRAEKEASSWREKCSQATNKASQAEQKAYALEVEVKKLQRALQREVGDDVSLNEILDGESDWRGRAQKIIALQHKIKDMKAAQGIQSNAGIPASRKNLERMARERREEADSLSAELKRAQEELKLEKQSLEKNVCRRKVLEREMRGMKEKLSVLLEKTTNDDKLVAALKGELQMVHKNPKLRAPSGDLQRLCEKKEAQIQKQQEIILELSNRISPSQDSLKLNATTKR